MKMYLSVSSLLLISIVFWLLKQQKIESAITVAPKELLILQKMKPIALNATKPEVQGINEDLENSNWFTNIQDDISRSEYFIKQEASSGNLFSPNRKNNLHFTYDINGFSVKPRITKFPLEEMKSWQDFDDLKYKTIQDWTIRFNLNNTQWGKGYWKIADNKAEYITDKVTVQYDNQEEGMRQNFVVNAPLEKGKKLTIGFKVSTSLKVNTNKSALDFSLKNEVVMQYKDLRVWDANGKNLNASLHNEGKDAYIIEVDDKKAIYPITIDPISTTASTTLESNLESAFLGGSVAGAGDVNGDGYSDVIVGATGYSNGQASEGAFYIFHGSASGINTTPALRVESNQENAQLGRSVAGAGDVNGDGYNDVIVGAINYTNGETNEGAFYVYHGSSTGISATAAMMVESNQAGANLGNSVSGAGDVNGDGYSDVIVGAVYYSNGQSSEGAFYVYHGSSSGISTSAAMVESNQANAQLGFSVSRAGDVNGDGYSDVIVGAIYYANGQSNEGGAFIYHGSSTGIGTTASTTVESNQAGARLGWSVSGAGDVNGDGYSDVIAGAPFYANGETDEGVAFIYHGRSTGISTTAATMVESNKTSGWLGYSVAGTGDTNGDGYSDVIVGVRYYANGQNNEGAAYFFQGSSTGISTTVAATLESNQVNAEMGSSVSGAGDVNGDGISDIIVGAQYYDNGETDEGASFIYQGSASSINSASTAIPVSNQASAQLGYSVSGAGDVNGDGYSDVIVGANLYDNGETDEGAAFIYHGSSSGIGTTAAARVESNKALAQFGRLVSGAGDVNGDGYSDVIVGAHLYANGQATEGAFFVYHGSSSGISTTAATLVESNQATAQMGYSVSGAGDVNGDGYSDVIVGANQYTLNYSQEGAFFVYHGSSSGISSTPAAWGVSNQATAKLGFSVSGAGDVNGDGYSDVIVGANSYDNGETDEGAAFVYHGSSSGINNTAATFLEYNISSISFGQCVSGAGDVNGDGYSDVIIGARNYSNGETNEGAAFVYHGSASGISTTLATMVESNMASAAMGQSVSGAGDINGDGYSDVIVGAHFFANGQTNEGAFFIYRGSSSGIINPFASPRESNINTAYLGISVSGAGDVNGDGYSDVIVGALGYTKNKLGEGAAFLYLGNGGGSYAAANNIKAYNANASTIINQANASETSFGAGLFAKSFQGKTKGKLVWEVAKNGSPFSIGSTIGNSVSSTSQQSSFTDLGITGASLVNSITKMNYLTTKIRVRVKYDLSTSLNGQVYGPWRYLYEAEDLQRIINLNAASSTLPVSGIELNGTATDKQVKLAFKALNEREMDNYVIERSLDGTNFTNIGLQQPLNASQVSASYNFVDNQPIVGNNYYRIKGSSKNGQIQYSNIVVVKYNTNAASVSVVPNPIQGKRLQLKLSQMVKGNYNISVIDIFGRILLQKEMLLDGNGSLQLNLPNSLKAGNYLVKVEGKGSLMVEKFVY
jgi:hypothetical protein